MKKYKNKNYFGKQRNNVGKWKIFVESHIERFLKWYSIVELQ